MVEVVSQLAQADIRDGILWLEESPLTSERLYARASMLLGENGLHVPGHDHRRLSRVRDASFPR